MVLKSWSDPMFTEKSTKTIQGKQTPMKGPTAIKRPPSISPRVATLGVWLCKKLPLMHIELLYRKGLFKKW